MQWCLRNGETSDKEFVKLVAVETRVARALAQIPAGGITAPGSYLESWRRIALQARDERAGVAAASG